MLRTLHTTLRWLTLASGTATLALFSIATLPAPDSERLTGVIIRQPRVIPWTVFEGEELEAGLTGGASTHIVLHLPLTFTEIDREVLLGHKGKIARYWGYCFPPNYDPSVTDRRAGFPGLFFLSEAERAVRAQREQTPGREYSLVNLPTKEDVQARKRHIPPVRHQIETFTPGMLCYVMSDQSLAIGLDADGDRLNGAVERGIMTDPNVPDTDGDGIWDGVEFLRKTDPLMRDTDGDGIIDGIEDKDWDGKMDRGETDPRTKDSDRDGLCDGFCRIKLGHNQEVFIGEDKNLNGVVDSDETNPLLIDSNGDRLSDYQMILNCLREGRDC